MSSKQLFAVATVAGIAVAQKASSVAETSVHSRTTEEDQSAEMVDEELALKLASIPDMPDSEMPPMPEYPHVGFFDPSFKIEGPHASSVMEKFAKAHASMLEKAQQREQQKQAAAAVPSSLFQTADKQLQDVHRHEQDSPPSLIELKSGETATKIAEVTPEEAKKRKTSDRDANGVQDYGKGEKQIKNGEKRSAQEMLNDASGGGQMTWANGNSNSCFPSDALVELRDSSTKPMYQLAVGDIVRTAAGYEPITTFLHAQRTHPTDFLAFSFENSEDEFVTTQEHRVFSNSGMSIKAGDVNVGDVLIGSDGVDRVISSIEQVTKPDGFFAPLTSSGTIMVNNVLASTYAGGPSGTFFQTIAYIVCSPMRFFGVPVAQLTSSFPANSGLGQIAS